MRRTRVTFYVDKVPGQPLKGRGWIDISDFEVAKRLNISLTGEHTNSRIYIRISQEDAEYESLKSERYKSAVIRSGWIIEVNSTIPRLTSCYPFV